MFVAIGSDVPHADVVAENDKDIRPLTGRRRLLLRLRDLCRRGRADRGRRREHSAGEQDIAAAGSTSGGSGLRH